MMVLVTGGAGYIGAVLIRQLLKKGFKVRVIDSLKFGGEALDELMGNPSFDFYQGDIRNLEDVTHSMEGVDAIVHLAAIVGDPACKKYSEEAMQTNWIGSVQLFEIAEKMGIKRFVFASTCSNYGKMTDPNSFVVETSELKPVSLYAELKVKFENFLLQEKKIPLFAAQHLDLAQFTGFLPE
jgi:nucleoside-diphosphate-sugar epimerase